jgi:hypothetical protein
MLYFRQLANKSPYYYALRTKGKILNLPVYQLLGGTKRADLEWILMMDEPSTGQSVKYIMPGFIVSKCM